MKARKTLTLLLLAALTFAACKYDDSELWEQVNQNTEELAAQAARIAALEAWQAETNTNIQALQTLLSTTDYITAVTPVVKDGVEVGFTISFLNTPAITIYHGTKGDKGDKGDTPQIGATQADDGNWYWTLNGELLTDTDGNPIRANGTQGEQGDQGPAGDDAPLPQLATGAKLNDQGITTDSQNNAIEPDAIYLSVDGGQTWTRVSGKDGDDGPKGDDGEKGDDGDSFFDSVDYTTYDDYVIFTLAENGGTFSVPRYVSLSLTLDVTEIKLGYGNSRTITGTVKGSDNLTKDNFFFIGMPKSWQADITLTGTELAITFTTPEDGDDYEGDIFVTLDNKKGNTAIGQITAECNSTYLSLDNADAGALAAAIGQQTGLTSITVTSGEINDADWAAIKNNRNTMLYLDLEGVRYPEATPTFNGESLGQYPLQTAKLPQGIVGIGDRAFRGCESLTSIDIPDGVTSIGYSAFAYCKSLKTIDIPDGVTSIGYSAFAYCKSLKTIDIPDGVTSIETAVFYGCSSLETIHIPDGVTSIGQNAFRGCSGLKTIDIPDRVTSIGEGAFANCSSLTTIDISDGVTSIGNRAFINCTRLNTVTCLATTPPTLGWVVFSNCTSLAEIKVPAGSAEAYKAASEWSEYADIIFDIPEP